MALAMALGAALAGCGPATYNVRASRAFANEDANPAIVADRTADLERAVALADELLMEAPYSPGDRWIAALHLDDEEGDALRDRLAEAAPYGGQYELPLVKLYRMKIEEALRQAKAPRATPARYQGLLEAAATLAPKASALPASWRALVEAKRGLIAAEGELNSLTAWVPLGTPDTPQIVAARVKVAGLEAAARAARRGIDESAIAIRGAADAADAPGKGEKSAQRSADGAVILARDLVNAVSFLERMHVEALAVAPYVLKQTRRLPRTAGDPLPPNVDRARALGELLEEEREALDPLSSALAAVARIPLSEAAGYQMHEGLLAQAAAINFDATHLKLKGDAELLFFHAIASAGSSGGTNDYTGRTRRLDYEVDPVSMIGASASLTYDFAHVRNAASLNAGFKTDRLFSQGGDIAYDNSLGQLLGLEGIASDIFDIGADLVGITTRAKFVRFTSGQVSEIAVDPASNRDTGVVEIAPFQLQYAQVDVGFDFTRIFPEEAEGSRRRDRARGVPLHGLRAAADLLQAAPANARGEHLRARGAEPGADRGVGALPGRLHAPPRQWRVVVDLPVRRSRTLWRGRPGGVSLHAGPHDRRRGA
jgi:hypothetical protein